MNCQGHRENEIRRDCSLGHVVESDRNGDTMVPMSLDLESMCLSYQLPRYLVPTSCEEPIEQLPFSMEIDRSSLFGSDGKAAECPPPEKLVHIESLFQSGYSSEKTLSQPKESQPKKRKPYAKRAPKKVIQLEEGESMLNLKVNFQQVKEKENQEATLKKGKSCSEPPTEDSASTFETVSFPGLAGSQAYFNKGTCVACKQIKIAFWFGDSTTKRHADKFMCAECIKSGIGEERFMSLFHIECQWANKTSCDLGLKKPWQSLKEYVLKHQPQYIDLSQISINYLLEEKKYSVEKTLTKMTSCLMTLKNKGDLDTLLLCLRFIHDLVESINRLAYILTKSTANHKLECMDIAEKEYYQKEVARIESLVVAIKVEASKCMEAEATIVKDLEIVSINPVQSLGFGLDYDETPVLGKRDATFRNADSYPDLEVADLDAPYKIAPFSCDFMMSKF